MRVYALRCLGVLAAAAMACPAAAHATAGLTLSDASSDETAPALLDARLTFALSGDELTLTVENHTLAPFGFDISAIYFNASPSVDSLSLPASPTGWTLEVDKKAGGFGTFDFALLSERGNDPAEIGPGQSSSFVLDVSASGPLSAEDFTSFFSDPPPAVNLSLAAAKFVNGPGDDSAFGAVVPEPATLLLMLLAAAFVGLSALEKRR